MKTVSSVTHELPSPGGGEDRMRPRRIKLFLRNRSSRRSKESRDPTLGKFGPSTWCTSLLSSRECREVGTRRN